MEKKPKSVSPTLRNTKSKGCIQRVPVQLYSHMRRSTQVLGSIEIPPPLNYTPIIVAARAKLKPFAAYSHTSFGHSSNGGAINLSSFFLNVNNVPPIYPTRSHKGICLVSFSNLNEARSHLTHKGSHSTKPPTRQRDISISNFTSQEA